MTWSVVATRHPLFGRRSSTIVAASALDEDRRRPPFRHQQLGVVLNEVDQISDVSRGQIDTVDSFCQPACYSNPHGRIKRDRQRGRIRV